MDGCYGAGSMFLSKKDTSESVQAQNRDKGVKLLDTACKNDHQSSCFNLSAIYIKGLMGVEIDMKKALEYSAKSCDLGHIYGCANTSRIYAIGDGVEKDEKLAAKFKERAKALQTEAQETKRQLKFGET